MNYKLILTVIFSGTFLIVFAVQEQTLVKSIQSQPALVTADSADARNYVPFANISPPISFHHNQKDCQTEKEIITDFQMPVFIPDSSLTASMPIFSPPPVDEKMIIPFDKPSPEQCD